VIIGINGAGKSMLSNELGKLLNIEDFHLDKIYWKPGWVKIPSEEGKAIQRKLTKRNKWIFDGNWIGSLDIRLKPADTIIYLDFPKWFCLYRILKRGFFSRGQSFDKQEGVNEKVNWFIIRRLLSFPKKSIMETVNKYADGRNVYIFKSQEEVDKFLKELEQ